MPSPFEQFLTHLKLSTGRLNSPAMQAEQQDQDMNPVNIPQIDQELGNNPNAVQQGALMNERQRLQAVQLKQLQQASQQFAPRLAQSLDIQTHTGMPLEGPAERMVKLMLRMQKRPVNTQRVPNPNPARPFPPMGGIRG